MSCKYCDSNKICEDLFYKNGTHIYIDTDEKKLIFNHIEVKNDTGKPWDDYEDTLYMEFDIKYCPICSSEL